MDLGFNEAGDLDKIPELCDYAIDAVADLAKFAKEAKSGLEDVKKEAEKQLSQRRSNRRQGGGAREDCGKSRCVPCRQTNLSVEASQAVSRS
jgi:sialic acid synthase SpsE